MNIEARLNNSDGRNEITVSTDGIAKEVIIPSKEGGYGSLVNGGEILFLALAVCFCNDIYREAPAFGVRVTSVEVKVSGTFSRAGETAQDVVYEVRVEGDPVERVRELVEYVDTIAEIHNSLRRGVWVKLVNSPA